MSQQETAMATATRARRAVMTRAMMNPILETQTSSLPVYRDPTSVRAPALRSIVRMAFDCTYKINLYIVR